jgi:crossover junction endodeoxyribonuclease RuvC
MPTIVGIDPGLAATGIGIVRGNGLSVDSYSYGAIATSQVKPLPARLDEIYTRLSNLLKDTKPDLVVVEDVFSLDKYPKSGIILGKVSGIILLAGVRAGVATCEVPVREAKQILTGNGNAGKKQLEKAVRHTLQMTTPIRPFHAADALGLALIGLFRYRHQPC